MKTVFNLYTGGRIAEEIKAAEGFGSVSLFDYASRQLGWRREAVAAAVKTLTGVVLI